jgi:hypothetical protein
MIIINIGELEPPSNQSDKYQATVAFDGGKKFPCTIVSPFSTEQENALAWYLDQYANNAEKKKQAKKVAASIEGYGKQLFKQVFKDNADIYARYYEVRQKELLIEITGSPAFHSLHWETLHDPELSQPLALDVPIVRKYHKSPTFSMGEDSHTINLLIVTARPHGQQDVDYRTISRPIVDDLRQAKLPVKIHILRPGTYHALTDHLAKQKKGYYHIIHFDVHGVLREGKTFLFLDSGTDNQPAPVKATELAQLLVQHHIPITILNACESGKQVGIVETSLSGQFMHAGVPMVLAMRYTITAGAAKMLMRDFYQNLFAKQDVATAIRLARSTLYHNKARRFYGCYTSMG